MKRVNLKAAYKPVAYVQICGIVSGGGRLRRSREEAHNLIEKMVLIIGVGCANNEEERTEVLKNQCDLEQFPSKPSVTPTLSRISLTPSL
jgi:hypothetical protein